MPERVELPCRCTTTQICEHQLVQTASEQRSVPSPPPRMPTRIEPSSLVGLDSGGREGKGGAPTSAPLTAFRPDGQGRGQQPRGDAASDVDDVGVDALIDPIMALIDPSFLEDPGACGCQSVQTACETAQGSLFALDLEPAAGGVCVAHSEGDAVWLDTHTDNLRSPSLAALMAKVDRSKKYSKRSYAPKGSLTIKLPEVTPGDWKSKRDFVSELTSHMKRQGLVGKRACHCGGSLWSSEALGTLEIWEKEDGSAVERRLKLEGIQRCERPKECLFCARWDDMQRCKKLYQILTGHTQQGGAVYFLTLTVPHRRDDPLHLLMDLLKEAWNGLNKACGDYLKKRRGVAWWFKVMEVTFGPHGGHPHFHVALGFDEVLAGTQVDSKGAPDKISERIKDALEQPLPHTHESWSWSDAELYCAGILSEWKRQVEKLAPKILGRQVEVDYGAQDFRSMGTVGSLPGYLAKTGIGASLEMSHAKEKRGRSGGRSLLELMIDICEEGRESDIALWLEYRAAVEGRRRIYTKSGRERNPEVLYEGVEVPPMPEPRGVEGEDGEYVRWLKKGEEEPFMVPRWLYQGLYNEGLCLSFVHETERLGSLVVGGCLDRCKQWYVEDLSRGRVRRIALKLVRHLGTLDDVLITLPPHLSTEAPEEPGAP